MNEARLAWDTYNFYTHLAYTEEVNHTFLMKNFDILRKNNWFANEEAKSELKNKLINSCDSIVNVYLKQVSSISELINLHKKGSDILKSKRVDVQTFIELKNLTSTLIEEIKVQKSKINQI